MSDEFKPKLSLSEDMFSSFALHKKEINVRDNPEQGSTYEVFRNGTTAIELIVKDVANRQKRNDTSTSLKMKRLQNEIDSLRSHMKQPRTEMNNDEKIKKMQAEIDKLKKELNESKASLNKMKNRFKIIIQRMKNQLDIANQRELEEQIKNVTLQLEKEKLSTLLISKTNLVNKFKEELANFKRVLKFVVKNINNAPKVPELFDIEYKDFEVDLKTSANVPLNKVYEGTTTLESCLSKDGKSSFG